MSRRNPDGGWDGYLERFHRDRAGITERVLARSFDASGRTAYNWVAAVLPETGLVVDVACGSAPLWTAALSGRYLGVDASPVELELARRRGAHQLIVGTAEHLPAEDGAARAVVCSMALMVLPHLDAVLQEVRRVLAPEGVFVATVPGRPAGIRDLPVMAGLVRAVGGTLGYRNDAALRHTNHAFDIHGLRVVDDATRRFTFPLTDSSAAAEMAASLYLPDDRGNREVRAASYLQRLARRQEEMPIPIRRIVARPTGDAL